MPKPGELWECHAEIRLYPEDNGLSSVLYVRPGEVLLIVGEHPRKGVLDMYEWIRILYQERVWEVSLSSFRNKHLIPALKRK